MTRIDPALPSVAASAADAASVANAASAVSGQNAVNTANAAGAAGQAPPAPAVVVIPALEPAASLVAVVRELRADGIDVVVIDDGSGPSWQVTFDRCELLGAEVLHLPVNRGKGNALREAFAHVERMHPGAGVVTADADGQHTPTDIRRVRDELDRRTLTGHLQADASAPAPASSAGASARTGAAAPVVPLVLGVRAFAGDVPLRSRVGNVMSSLAFRAASGVALGDTQTGLRGIPAGALAWARTLPGDRYEYEYTMLVRAARDGIDLTTIPIETVYEDGNAVSHFRPVRDSLRVLAPVAGFAASSLAAFALDTALFCALSLAGAPIWAALAGARLVSSAGNFSLNRWVVFRGGARTPLLRSLLGYAALAAGVLLGGILLVDALVTVGVGLLTAKVIADLVLFCLSYVVQRLLVFRRG
ncbi:bifunctional glycosyltransferase family 2/GtrA family protein [Brachybacterium nesterenkovii]|uniref:bifunctional glycosyltransferase family 2/GtrA family protein n=1 Tax=Brachybacterium nesterenkovii TaxID=47847 RepID=UPI00321B4085